jgi:aarF domain-containing kinase
VQIAADYKWNLRSLTEEDPTYEETLSACHLRSANCLKDAFSRNGGAFIKVGQYIGSLDYLLPREYVQTMKSLHDKAPESTLDELFQTVETDLKRKVSDIFKEIDPKPIGTASLAQCHRAVLHDGTVVAVKIQHPKVKTNSITDIKTMLVRTYFLV